MVDRLIEGLALLREMAGVDFDVAGEHDTLYAGGPDPEELSKEETEALAELGWHWDTDYECWRKFI